MRQSVFEELARHDKPASAYDMPTICRKAAARWLPTASTASSTCSSAAIWPTGSSANAYLVNTHPGCRHDCIFLICDDCGKATHIDDERVSGALREAGRDAGFTDVRPVVELRGLCDDCAS